MPSTPPKPLQRSGSEDVASDEDSNVSPRTRKLRAAEDPVMTTVALANMEVGNVAAASSDDGDEVVPQYACASGSVSATVSSPRHRSGQHDSTNAPQNDNASTPLYPNVDAPQYSCDASFPLHRMDELLEEPILEEIDFDGIDPILLATRDKNKNLPNPYVPARGRGRSRSDAAARREPQTADTRPSSAATGSCSAAGRCLATGRCLHGCADALASLAACSRVDEGDAADDGGGWGPRGGWEPGSGRALGSDAAVGLDDCGGLDAGGGLGSGGGLDAGGSFRVRNRSAQDGEPIDETLDEPSASGRFRPRSAPQPRQSHPRGN